MAQDVLVRPLADSRSKVIAYPADRRATPRPVAYAVSARNADTRAGEARSETWSSEGRAAPAHIHAQFKQAGIQTFARSAQAAQVAKPVSFAIVAGILRAFDAAVAVIAGPLALIAVSDWAVPAAYDLLVCGFGALLLINLMHLSGLYRIEFTRRPYMAVCRLVLAWTVTAAAVAIPLLYGLSSPQSQGLWLLAWIGGGFATTSAGRLVLAGAIQRWREQGRLRQRVAVLGSGPIGQRLLRRINAEADPDVEIVGVYDDRLSRLASSCMGHPIRGTADDLIEHVRQRRIDMVVVALPLSAERRMDGLLAKLRQVAVDVCLCPDQFGFRLPRVQLQKLAGVSLLGVEERPLRDWRGVAKSIEDRIVAGAILVMIAPILAAIAILIKLDSPGPVFFRQKRYGLNNQLIEVLKFRTMYQHATDANAEQLTRRNDPRVTRIGAFLRRTSLDELPQFINVLRGEMSVVGPRPHALAAKAGGLLYQDAVPTYYARHRMKPGITGWAQINGWRGETETVEQIEKRVEHDLHYIENWSVWLDLTIIFRTIFGGFTGRQAY